jgi:superfamily II DNA helicase RecQ
VIEPLRALIDSQIDDLRKKGLKVEELLPKTDACNINELQAKDRLQELVNRPHSSPYILFLTPELFECVQDQVKEMVKRQMISLIVVDEYDCIEEANFMFRPTYLRLVPRLRVVAPSVPFFFLSATASKTLLAYIMISRRSSEPPHLYRTADALPTNHIYEVKRKYDNKQVSRWISENINDG